MSACIFQNIAKAGAVSPTTLNGLPGMTSREISEITGKGHHHVLRDIRKMVDELGLEIDPNLDRSFQYVQTTYEDGYGRFQAMTVLDKELTFTLLSRYSFKLSNLIVKRWLELEGSGFARVSVQETMARLTENQDRNQILRSLNKGRRKPQRSPEERRLDAMTRRNRGLNGGL
ncbi:Rha family transcriptional regulator [Pseudomonas sp. MPFS]|uniref:Rha family transcriptional regulator n=1 Tax=Pseudomonas sp. MPFS TaxID=2795724 RepID=UPI001F12C025|nr:Rha family transcriptional regulator [Pseudomonas sp. MPFS]UMZ14718.1 Rha family transcriptional regulator [Pseudomonas sp. MPFS]